MVLILLQKASNRVIILERLYMYVTANKIHKFMMGMLNISVIAIQQLSIQYQVSFWITTSSVATAVAERLSSYECGFETIGGDARMKFDVTFYIIALLYLIFDLEVIFLFPLAVILNGINSIVAQLAAMGFLTILTIGFIYEIKQGAQSQVSH